MRERERGSLCVCDMKERDVRGITERDTREIRKNDVRGVRKRDVERDKRE